MYLKLDSQNHPNLQQYHLHWFLVLEHSLEELRLLLFDMKKNQLQSLGYQLPTQRL